MKKIIIVILSSLIQDIFASYYFISIANCNKNAKSKFSLILTFLLITTTITSILNLKQYNTLLNTIILGTLFILIVKFIIKTSTLKSILIVVSYYIIMAITELISFYILKSTLNISSDILMTTSYDFLVFLILQHVLAVILVLLFNTFIIKKYDLGGLTFRNLKLLLLMIAAYILPQFIIFPLVEYSYPLPLMIVNIIQIVLVSFLILVYFKSIINKEKLESELSATELHNKTLIEIVDGVRTLKHDYGNIIQALNGYIVTKQYDRLHEYIDSLIKEFGSVNNISAIDPRIFNEPAIYGVVGAKYFYATEHDITFEIEVTTNIKNISFSKPELSRIFGVLLDNAIEATQKAKNKYIKLEVSFNDKKYADVIRIINTYDTSIDIDLEEIYKKGVSTKEKKSGIGLWEVKKLVNKNKHSQIYTTIEKHRFVQNLIIERID